MKLNKKVLILGGYGNFGSRIAEQLAKLGIALIINGRNAAKAEKLIKEIHSKYPKAKLEAAIFDNHRELEPWLKQLQPTVLIHTSGPFQGQNTQIAKTCIKQTIHYIDLADGREFIKKMINLNDEAQKNETMVITGASSVPTLTAAVLEHHQNHGTRRFVEFDSLQYGISPGQKTDRGGLATIKAVLSYIGKPIKTPDTAQQKRYGWQDIYLQKYPEIGHRLMGNCEVPDLDLIPHYYPVKKLHFSAGMESKLLHIIIWLLSWLIRGKIPINLPKHAGFLLRASHWFDFFGTADGGMHLNMKGKDQNGKTLEKTWFIIAKDNHGPFIPTIPAVIMTKKIVNDEYQAKGAVPCIGLLTLEEYLDELKDYNMVVKCI